MQKKIISWSFSTDHTSCQLNVATNELYRLQIRCNIFHHRENIVHNELDQNDLYKTLLAEKITNHSLYNNTIKDSIDLKIIIL